MSNGMSVGISLFSLTPAWRQGDGVVEVLERVAEHGAGPALEVVGAQSWRGWPHHDPSAEADFTAAVERLGLQPVVLAIYLDLYRRPAAALTDEQARAALEPQLDVAQRLGFPMVRIPMGAPASVLHQLAQDAGRRGLAVTIEVQGTNPPDHPGVLDLLAVHEALGDVVGLTLDVSLTTPALPEAFGTALRRLGLADAAVAQVYEVWAREEPLGDRIGAAFALLGDGADRPALETLVAGVFLRTGRQRPQEWAHLLPIVRHVHAKYWEPPLDSLRDPYSAWLGALAAVGYCGAVVSEWGGHELLDRADLDAFALSGAHVALLRELVDAVDRGPVPDHGQVGA